MIVIARAHCFASRSLSSRAQRGILARRQCRAPRFARDDNGAGCPARGASRRLRLPRGQPRASAPRREGVVHYRQQPCMHLLARNWLRCRRAGAFRQSSRGRVFSFRATHEAHEESVPMPLGSSSEALPHEAGFFFRERRCREDSGISGMSGGIGSDADGVRLRGDSSGGSAFPPDARRATKRGPWAAPGTTEHSSRP